MSATLQAAVGGGGALGIGRRPLTSFNRAQSSCWDYVGTEAFRKDSKGMKVSRHPPEGWNRDFGAEAFRCQAMVGLVMASEVTCVGVSLAQCLQ